MKTNSSHAICIALTSLFFLSSVISLTEGKCSGRWAIHACWGGNGKRSGAVTNQDVSSNMGPLQMLLLRSYPAFLYPLPPQQGPQVPVHHTQESEEDFQSSPASSSLYDPEDVGEPPEYMSLPFPSSSSSSSSSLNGLKGLLKKLRKLQAESNRLP